MSNVVNNEAEHRFEINVEGHVAAAYYELSDGVITFTHTEVPKELGGRGIGSQLAKAALEQSRAKGLKVITQCSFMSGYVGKHPEYSDLLK